MGKNLLVFLAVFTVNFSVFCEESNFDGELSLWKKSSEKQVFVDTECKVRGSSSIRIENGGTLSRTFELEPETEYELTFYVRGKDIQSGEYSEGRERKPYGGRIQLYDGKKWGRITSGSRMDILETGTFDWRFGRSIIKSSDWGKKLNIQLAIRGKGTVWFDEVQLKKIGKSQKIHSFRERFDNSIQALALVPQGCFGFFEPGEKVGFIIRCKSRAEKIEYAYTVKDENGKVVLSVPRKILEKKFTIPGQPCGYYVVEAVFYADGKKSRMLQSAFAVSRKIENRDPFFQAGGGAHQAVYDGLKRIGIGTVCLKLTWQNPRSTPEKMWKYNYDTKYRRFLEMNDFSLIANLTSALKRTNCRNSGKLAEGWPLVHDKLLQDYIRYIDLVLAHTKGKIKIWQFQTEVPSRSSDRHDCERTWSEAMSNFMVMTRIGSRRVRKADPAIRILAGGNNMQAYTKDIERIVMGDLAPDFDQYVIDGYTGNWDMEHGKVYPPEVAVMSFYNESSKLSEFLGKGKIICNAETGYSISYGSPFDCGLAVKQAEYTARQLIIAKAGPVASFELHNPCQIPGFREYKDSDRCMTTVWKPVWFGKEFYHVPLPGGAMYAAAASQLAFAKNLRYFHEGNNYGAVFTKPDGKTLLILWNIEEDFSFEFTFPAGTAAVSMYGRESIIPAGKQILKLNHAPVYLTLNAPANETAEKVCAELKKQSPQIRCCGYELEQGLVKVFVRNISAETQNGILQGKKISILPGQIQAFELKSPEKKLFFRSDSGRQYAVYLQKNKTVKIRFLSRKPVFDGSGSWLKGLEKGTLSYPDDIFPISALQKELGYFKSEWNPGGHNVSADYWLACDKENFYLAVDVDDPVHLQRHTGTEIWMDDSLQFVFENGEPVPRELASPTEKLNRPSWNFGAALTGKGAEFVNYSGKKVNSAGCRYNVVRKGKRTFYEVCIPFKVFGQKPARFGFIVFDNNFVTKKSAPYHLNFSGGVTADSDVSELKRLSYEAEKE